MGQPAAALGDKITGICTHTILNPSPGGPVPTPTPHPYMGLITQNTATNVMIMNKPAATMGSMAMNTPPHIPIGAGPFAVPPTNQATINKGSATVLIGGKPAARAGDTAITCSEIPSPGTVVAVSTVLIGG